MKSPRAIVSIALYAVLACCSGLLHAQRSNEPVTLNFVGAEIEAVARTMAAITGRNVIVDPRVKGTISLTTERPVPPAAAFNQFVATLRLAGYTVVESAGIWRVVPEADARLQAGAVSVGPAVAGGSQIVTQIFRLNYENANNLVPVLRPLISPNNTINVNAGNNSLVITDYADNLQRIGRIIAALDVSNATDVEVIPLRHALASDLAPLVARLVEASGSAAVAATPGQPVVADATYRTAVIAEPRSNSLIARAANPARLALVRSLVAKLDQPASQSAAGNIYVVYLKNADATKLAVTLRAALAGNAPTLAAGASGVPSLAPGAAGTTANAATAPIVPSGQPSTGGQIQADPATNALIITAPEPQYRQLRAVIDLLDSRRAQVHVESLIVEVNAEKAAEFGVQWQTLLGGRNDRNIGVLGTNFTIGGANIIDLSVAAAAQSPTTLPSTGINLGLVRNLGGLYILSTLARFLESKADGNILSTPSLLTLDNEEAKIVIGQNVPFVTGQYTNSATSTNGVVNPFQTVERKDVGLTLRIKPQISENGTVRLTIFQEISSVQPGSINSVTGLITNKRSIESNVVVEDGAVVVLGGLLQDQFANNEQKVPAVGDIPLLGNLFRAETRSRTKTNLMVFLRPVVVREPSTGDALAADRYDMMRTMQLEQRPEPSRLVPINESPELPALRTTPQLRPGAAPVQPPLGR